MSIDCLLKTHRKLIDLKVSGSQIELKGVIDIDGSLTGIAGAQLVERFNNAGGNPQSYLQTDLSIEHSDWNVFINPKAKTGNMWLRNLDDNSTSFVVTRSDGEQIDRETSGTQFPFIYGDQFIYKMDFQTTTPSLEFYMHDVPYSDAEGFVIFEITGIGAGATFELNENLVQEGDMTKVIEATSMELMQAAHRTAIYRDFENKFGFYKVRGADEARLELATTLHDISK